MGLTDLVKLTRPVNCSMIGFAVIVGSGIALGEDIVDVPLMTMISGFVVGFTICSVSMIINDIFDIEIDKINRPERPLPSGKTSVKTAYLLATMLGIIGLFSAHYTGIETAIVAFTSLVIGVYYNAWGKKQGLIGNIMVAYNIGIPILYGALMVNAFKPHIVIYWIMVFLTGLAREIVKDLADIRGDSKKGVKSLAITKGIRVVVILSTLLYIISVLISPLPIVLGKINPYGYGIPVFITDFLLIYSIILLARNPNPSTAYTHKRIVLIAMFTGLIGFLLGNI